MAGCCEYGDERSGSGAKELVIHATSRDMTSSRQARE
jgi:hypothetical protein